ncbi:geobacillin-26 family protein [Mangrovibacillus sp. Mu-81]|uniref:geobacillin-26 family protein n=1 Tax=Mangrovibacillus sp. Mu-81 TaxID=3121478 RepID=UPI002FE4886A
MNKGEMHQREKTLVLVMMFFIFFLMYVSMISADSPFVIGEEQAGGYQYKVIKDELTFFWSIGHQDSLSVIVENKENSEALESFRTSVEEIDSATFTIIISTSYLFIVILTTLFICRKNKQILKGSAAIIAVFAGIALYYTILNGIDLHTSLQNANVYYSMLTD